MRIALCLALGLVMASCGSAGPVRPPPRDLEIANRLVVHLDTERKIVVRTTGTIIMGQGTVGKIDARGKVTDRTGKLLAWLHKDNVRVRGGAVIPIRTGNDGEIYLSPKAQRKAGVTVVALRVKKDGSIASESGSARGERIEGESSLDNRRLAMLLLFLYNNNALDDTPPSAP